jgi:outer membrane lipoprotein-sorting protein
MLILTLTERTLMQHFRTITATIAGLFIVTSATVVRAEGLKTSQEVMDIAASKMTAYRTWSADYSQDVNMLGKPVVINGQVVQKPPHRVWMQLAMPIMGQMSEMTMVMGQDGIMWQVVQIGSQQQIMKMDVNKIGGDVMAQAGVKGNPLDQFDPGKQLEMIREVCDFSLVAGRELEGQPMYVLDGVWKQGALTNQQMAAVAAMVGKTRVFIGQADGFVHRLEQFDKSQTNIAVAMEFKNLKFNQDVPDTKFVYQPPADAHVIDITPSGGVRMSAQPRPDDSPSPKTAPPPQVPTPTTPSVK